MRTKLWKYILPIAILGIMSSCEDDVKKEVPKKANFSLSLSTGNKSVMINDTADFDQDYDLYLSTAKFYLSNITLIASDGRETALEDVVLVDFSRDYNVQFSLNLPRGKFTKLRMGIGVDADQNNSDPNSFANDHPLAAYQGMYWTMTKYRFVVLEGRAFNKTGGTEIPFTYHIGTDPVYKVVTFDTDIDSESSSLSYQLGLNIDLKKAFNGPAGRIDFSNQPTTHSEGPAFEIARVFMENLPNAIQLNTTPSVD